MDWVQRHDKLKMVWVQLDMISLKWCGYKDMISLKWTGYN